MRRAVAQPCTSLRCGRGCPACRVERSAGPQRQVASFSSRHPQLVRDFVTGLQVPASTRNVMSPLVRSMASMSRSVTEPSSSTRRSFIIRPRMPRGTMFASSPSLFRIATGYSTQPMAHRRHAGRRFTEIFSDSITSRRRQSHISVPRSERGLLKSWVTSHIGIHTQRGAAEPPSTGGRCRGEVLQRPPPLGAMPECGRGTEVLATTSIE
jgi:hypothetical protein